VNRTNRGAELLAVVNFDYGHQEEQEETPAAQKTRHNVSAIAREVQSKKSSQEKSRREEEVRHKENVSFASRLRQKEVVTEENSTEESSRSDG
jgi:hypothetical protein